MMKKIVKSNIKIKWCQGMGCSVVERLPAPRFISLNSIVLAVFAQGGGGSSVSRFPSESLLMKRKIQSFEEAVSTR